MLRRFSRFHDRRPSGKPGFKKSALRTEPLEPRMMLSVDGLVSSSVYAAAFSASGPASGQPALASADNQAPVVAKAVSTDLNPVVTERTAALMVLGADDGGEEGLVYSWWATRAPSGATASFSASGTNDAKNTTVTFSKAGTYSLAARITDSEGLSVVNTATVTVKPALVSITIVQASTRALANTDTPVVTTGRTDSFIVQGFDQFDNLLAKRPALVWSATTLPDGAPAPRFSMRGANTTVTYSQAGTYGLAVRATDANGCSVSDGVTEIVTPLLTSFTMTPSTSTVVTQNSTQQFTVQRVLDQFGKDLPTRPALAWSTLSAPKGATAPTFTTSDDMTTVAFCQAGTYKLAARMTDPQTGRSLVKNVTVKTTMTPVLTSLVITSGNETVINGTSQLFAAQGIDQFGKPVNLPATYAWSATTIPSGAEAPTFSVNRTTAARSTTATFSQAGTYAVCATATDAAGRSVTSTVTVLVNQTLSSIVVTPNTAAIDPGATQQFAAQAVDQFQDLMAPQPEFGWTASTGQITGQGLWTAPGTAGSAVVTAASGSIQGTASVVVGSSLVDLNDAALESLVQSLYADGSISRLDTIQILRSVGSDDGVVDAIELGDLRTIVDAAATLGMAQYVQVLAGDVIDGNPANAHYQGQTLGDLAAGSSSAVLNKLVDKWFLGADQPNSGGYAYRSTAGSLFVNGPAYTDTRQGYLGDCYFIASLGTIAKSSPDAIQNMIVDNGDGTWTVRFYAGTFGWNSLGDNTWQYGYRGTATADYVTVDRMLPTDSYGRLIFANMGQSYTNANNELWIPLVEKAYAQWNETGRTQRDGADYGANSYGAIEGGWMSDVYNQVLGRDATEGQTTSGAVQRLIDAIAGNRPVTVGTNGFSGVTYGLYGGHAYQVVGYNSTNGTFTLHNPWGTSHPGPLTWGQIQETCDWYSIGDASESAPFFDLHTDPLRGAVDANALGAAASALLAWLDDSHGGQQSPAFSATLFGRTADALFAAGAYA